MGFSSLLKSPKKEQQQQQQLPNASIEEVATWDDFEPFFELTDREKSPPPLPLPQPQRAEDNFSVYGGGPPDRGSMMTDHFDEYFPVPLSQTNTIDDHGSGNDDDGNGDGGEKEEEVSLKLNLNYEEVLEAWSGAGRGSLWAAGDSSLSNLTNGVYMGEVPRMEEERTRRVMRYKQKRHNRLFSKKIRYQVRKLNADKRPRIKGRFVKIVS